MNDSEATSGSLAILDTWGRMAKGGMIVDFNPHLSDYMTADKWLEQREANIDEGLREEIGEEVWAKMVATNTIIRIQVYLHTPIGFFDVWAHDLPSAVIALHKTMMGDE